MPFKFIFKSLTLVLALGMTIYCIYLLNQGHLTDFMGSLGMGEYSKTFNWCTNRVTKMESLSKTTWTLEEKDKKWLVSTNGGEPLTLDYLAVEKWFAKYCLVRIQVYRNENLLDKHLEPFAKAQFNDGTLARIYTLEGDVFQINEVIFKSPQMKEGLAELQRLLKF